MKQPTLPLQKPRRQPARPAHVDDFDFEASADEWAKPRPGFVTPEHLRLPTDEAP